MSALRIAAILDSPCVYIEAGCFLQADGAWKVAAEIVLRIFDNSEKKYIQLFDREIPPAVLEPTYLRGIRGGLKHIWSCAKARRMCLYLDPPVQILIQYQGDKPEQMSIVVIGFAFRPPAKGRRLWNENIRAESRYTALALFASRDPGYQGQLSDYMGKYVNLLHHSASGQLPSWLLAIHGYAQWARGEDRSVETFNNQLNSTNGQPYPRVHGARGYARRARGQDISLGTSHEWGFPEGLRLRVQAYIQLGALFFDPAYLPLLSSEVTKVPSLTGYAFELDSNEFESVCAISCPWFDKRLELLSSMPQSRNNAEFAGWVRKLRAEWKAMEVSPEAAVASGRAHARVGVWTSCYVEVPSGQLSAPSTEWYPVE
ncbi:hypothetical protein DFH06DRAFT_1330936 [Mycena polygramma]|nr:hypothetical protein DFH06DRAFT_1330936 [Mycena polygramma]